MRAGFEPAITVLQTGALPLGYRTIHYSTFNDSNGNRTRVTAVKGRCLNRLTMEPQYLFSYEKTPRVGLEPTTTRLTAECSTIELSRKISCFVSYLRECYAFSEKSYKAKCEEILFIPSKPNTETLSLIP